METPAALLKWPITQSWAEHIQNTGVPGSVLGGVDRGMPIGTLLPNPPGKMKWVSRFTLFKPRWYNSGLGNAAAFILPSGEGTVYAHLSRKDSGRVYSGNTGTVTGPHLHYHGIRPDGHTRVPPFSNIPEGGGSGGGGTATTDRRKRSAWHG